MSRGPRPMPYGSVFTGWVKSYSAKGFGFILCDELDHDVYFPKESLQAGLRTCNIAGTHVTFELARGPGGKPQARSLRPVGGLGSIPRNIQGSRSRDPLHAYSSPAGGAAPAFSGRSGFDVRPADSSGFGFRPPMPPGSTVADRARRDWSPHAGSRAIAGVSRQEPKKKASSSSRSASSRRSRSSKSSGSSKKGRAKKRRRSSSSDDSEEKSRSRSRPTRKDGRAEAAAVAMEAAVAPPADPEVEDAKKEALTKLQTIRAIEDKEARMKEWRSLLRAWHPDKNPDRKEVATAVFQFLQKGKLLLDAR